MIASLLAAQSFDVGLEVQRAPGPNPPDLAFTGAPLLVLMALALVLFAIGATLLDGAGRRQAAAEEGQ